MWRSCFLGYSSGAGRFSWIKRNRGSILMAWWIGYPRYQGCLFLLARRLGLFDGSRIWRRLANCGLMTRWSLTCTFRSLLGWICLEVVVTVNNFSCRQILWSFFQGASKTHDYHLMLRRLSRLFTLCQKAREEPVFLHFQRIWQVCASQASFTPSPSRLLTFL